MTANNAANFGFGNISEVLTSNGFGIAPTFQPINTSVPGVKNLGISYSAGTFTVRGATASLSASNPASVTIASKTPGNLVTIPITANQTFTDGSSGQIDNMRWGITTGVNWANDMPFYLYAVINDAENAIAFMISRIPNRVTSPVAAAIGKAGAVVNTGQGDMYSLLSITTSDYESNPVLLLGSFRMQFAGATDSYTVQTLNNGDGIGQFNDQTIFNYPPGQNGNASGKYFLDNGGTAPSWASTQASAYNIDRFGRIIFIFSSNGSTVSTDGVGAVNLTPALPYAYLGNSLSDNLGVYERLTQFSLCYCQNPAPGAYTLVKITANQIGSDQALLNTDCTTVLSPNIVIKFNYISDITT